MGRFSNPFKAAKKVVKTVTKPIAKVLDKVVPNELKPYLPYLAAVAPILGPQMGILSNLTKLQAAGLYGGGALAAQLSQEGSEGDFDVLPIALAAGSGYFAQPKPGGGPSGIESLKLNVPGGEGTMGYPELTFGEKAQNLGIKALQGTEKFFQQGQGAEGFLGTTKALATAVSPAVTGQIGQDAYNFAKQAEEDYLAELDAFNALAGEQREASDEARRSAIIASMTRADFTQDIIDETLDQLGLKDGGIARLGFNDGGFEPFKFTSKIPKVFKEDAFGDDALGQIMKMSYAIRAPIIDVVRTVAKTATEAAKLTAAIAKLGYDITEPVRDLAGAGLKVGGKGIMEAFKESEDATRFIQPMYYLERFGPEKNLTDDETRLARAKRSSRADDEDIRKLENKVFGFDDAGINQRPEDRKISETIKLRERLGFDNGGDVDFGGIKEAIKGVAQNNMEEGVTQMYVSDSAGVIPLRDGDAVTGRTMEMMAMGAIEPYGKNDFRDPDGYERFIDIFTKEQDKNKELNEEGMKKGGLASYKDGGIMNLGGKEMDMRTGGFIPIGAKERADDVPARLSKNEFVMTADAVRAAGGGSVNKGAKRMYDLMHNLEARA